MVSEKAVIKTIIDLVKFADDYKLNEQERQNLFKEFQQYFYYCCEEKEKWQT